jgi:hypothetical protein
MAYEVKTPNFTLKSHDDDQFWYTGFEGTVLISFADFENQFKKLPPGGVGRSHEFYLNISELRWQAQQLRQGKGISPASVITALLRLHDLGINTGLRFGYRTGT